MNREDCGVARHEVFRIAVRKFVGFERAIRAQWDDFEQCARTGLKLEIETYEVLDLEYELLETDGMSKGKWDVCFVHTDWVATLHKSRRAANLAPLLKGDPPDDWPGGWSPSLLRMQSFDETIVGLPYHDGPECLIYRKDLFDDKTAKDRFHRLTGRDLNPPTTWTEFHEIARFFQNPEANLYGSAFAAFPDGHNSVYDFLLQLWTRGGELIDQEGCIQFQTEQAEAALQFYREIICDSSAVHPLCRELDSVRAGERFAAGEVAMMINWFGFAAAAQLDSHSATRDQVDVAPIPAGSPGKSVSLNAYWLLSIGSGARHPAVAWRFLRHVTSASMDRVTTLEGAIGCRRSTWSDSEVNQRIPFYWRMEDLHCVAREMPRRIDWPSICHVIDSLVTQTIETTRPIVYLLAEAQRNIAHE